MPRKILIANRGEIACRVIATARKMGVATVAVYSDADANALHVREADEAWHIGGAAPKDSYLRSDRLLEVIAKSGADAVHPGYGFLSENADFAAMVEEHGFTFIGPSAEHIRTMGDKITAKQTAEKLGIPVVPGSDGEITTVEEATQCARDIGYPVLIKASGGGGGRGMKVVERDEDLAEAFSMTRKEALQNFGNAAVYMEKYLGKPRHIELQVIGDSHGNAVHLFERDCSLQRRHQKVLEEAPSPTLTAEERERIGSTVANAMIGMGYCNAGTIEFLYENGEFYFIEMNTRLQVEHPVTEAIFGVDLVRQQIKVAAGEPMEFEQDKLSIRGHAIEVRINAEKLPNFSPCPGKITHYHAPGGLGVRMDSALYDGYTIPPYYDSLIGKLIVHGRDRHEALQRLNRALGELIVDGVDTTVPLFNALLAEPDIQAGNYSIHWLEKWLEKNL
jgi:acetyl-CoA carboxylase biotin carboxylase subunit